MRFSVTGYKCLSNRVEIDLGRINILWGPMGSGKSAILESFTIFHDIVGGREVIVDGRLRETSLEHLRGLEINKLLVSRDKEKKLEMTLSKYQYELSISSIIYPAAAPLFDITVSLQGNVLASIDGLTFNIVKKIFDAVKSYLEHSKSEQEILDYLPGDESREFFKKFTENMRKSPTLESFIKELVNRKIIYISYHRPSPKELGTKGTEKYTSYEWLSTGEHISTLITNLVLLRVSKSEEIKKLEECLKELEVILNIPAIQIIEEEGRLSIEVDKRDLRVLSSGERSSILLLLGAMQTPKEGFLIIEEPEIGLFIENFTKLLSKIIKILREKGKEGPCMIMSTHSYIPLHTLRTLILTNEVKREEVTLHYITREKENHEVRVTKIMLDEKGRPIFTPDVRDLLRECHVGHLERI